MPTRSRCRPRCGILGQEHALSAAMQAAARIGLFENVAMACVIAIGISYGGLNSLTLVL